jgi:MFS family permease
MMLAGISLFTAASLLCGVAPTLGMLIAARALQGLGAAIMMALAMALVNETIPKERTGSAMGLLGTMSALGTTLGPSLGGILLAGLGWRAMFLSTAPLGIITLVLASHFLPVDPPKPITNRPHFDWLGTVVLAMTLAGYALALTLGRGHFGALNIGLLLAVAVGAASFVRVESRAKGPLIQLAMFRSPALRAGLLTSALVSTVMMATMVVGPFYLSRALGLKAAVVGLVLSIGPMFAAFAGLPAGRIVDRLGASRVVITGLIGIGAACLTLSVVPTAWRVAGYVVPIVFLTTSYALFQAANNTAVMTDVRSDQRGVISGLVSLSRNLGLISGASAMGAVFAVASATRNPDSSNPEAVATGMRITFGVATLLIGGALSLAVQARNRSADGGLTGRE